MVRRSGPFGFMGPAASIRAKSRWSNGVPPDTAEGTYAKRILAKYVTADAAGRASFAMDGKMIDSPVVTRARRLLARHSAIEAR
jgi:citrate lyase subunit beta / citryl-CoA lyase